MQARYLCSHLGATNGGTMSQATLCDRCGDKLRRRTPKITRGALRYDLCGPCMDTFDKTFMKNRTALEHVTR